MHVQRVSMFYSICNMLQALHVRSQGNVVDADDLLALPQDTDLLIPCTVYVSLMGQIP